MRFASCVFLAAAFLTVIIPDHLQGSWRHAAPLVLSLSGAILFGIFAARVLTDASERA